MYVCMVAAGITRPTPDGLSPAEQLAAVGARVKELAATQESLLIDKLEKTTVELSQYKEVRELFPWFVGTGGALLGLNLLLSHTIGRRLP